MFPDHPAEMEPKIEALLHWCEVEGRDPSEIEWGVGVEPEAVSRLLGDADTYVAMGFTRFTLGATGPDWSPDGLAAWLAWRDERDRDR